MSSMSVHSLLDKESAKGGKENEPGAKEHDKPRDQRLDQWRQQPQEQPSLQPPLQATALSTPPSGYPPSVSGSANGLLSLLGPNVTTFPYSEQAYVETIKLRAEQERTKQDYYKLEIASKNLSILQTALRAQIPAGMIPGMCVGGVEPLVQQQQQQLIQQEQQTQLAQQAQPQFQYQPLHLQLSLMDIRRNLGQPDALSASPIPPVQYRFGRGNSVTDTNRNRPLSPAKIGAQAVANLATPSTPYRTTKQRQSHQRHYSMPVESLGRSPGKTVDLNRINEATAIGLKSRSLLTSLQPPAGESALSSPQGATSQIYVKPVPAQPLQKQTKQGHQPSQESMTSLQHIIQFHHWKPEFPGQQQPSNASSQRTPGQTHKRHKSHSDNMSVDLTTAPPPAITVQDQSGDVSMDTSMIEKDEKEVRGYPDILSNDR